MTDGPERPTDRETAASDTASYAGIESLVAIPSIFR
jgi:hypothetical protein